MDATSAEDAPERSEPQEMDPEVCFLINKKKLQFLI